MITLLHLILTLFPLYHIAPHPIKPSLWNEDWIPNDHYFVMDDNWWRGVDSRHFGPLAADRIEGKVVGVTEDYRQVLNHLPEDA
ncbi:S26 family signal peptidase [Paenibacillus lautus]|uniref:S26 family signal peptidase n=1 Tax=Paenibacillus lautus TaxID=1401 RepID=UPI002350FFF6|nr:S26 family signal peptidase [Paenibacillus lautus]